MKITYRKGYPSMACIEKLLQSYFLDKPGYFQFMYDSISFTGSIHWQRENVNEHIDSLVLFFNESGVEVENYDLYKRPRTGNIKFKKK